MAESFNLVHEPWICVRDDACRTQTVSLRDALVNAHRFAGLAGESPAQDAAMLRLLIAVIYTVFYRVDENGDPAILEDEDGALDRWEAIWKRKAFPSEPICAYLKEWEHRFDLLDKERPFYQVPEAVIGTEHTAAKLNGLVLESENKKSIRIFSGKTEANKYTLSFAEAARWLVYLQGFDDAGVKKKTDEVKQNGKESTVSPVSWMGKLGVIYSIGRNLFETIWLNTVYLRDGEKLYNQPTPCWEILKARCGEYSAFSLRSDIAELFTIQTRRVLLKQEDNKITAFTEYCGDLIEPKNAFAEPMTIWKPEYKQIRKKNTVVGFSPASLSSSRFLWRDFSAIVVSSEENRCPGITYWLNALQNEERLELESIRFAAVSVEYDNKKSSVTNTVSDSLSFHADLLSKAGEDWQKRIRDQIEFCDKLANAVGMLAGVLSVAAGKREMKDGKNIPPLQMKVAEAAKAQFYFRIDAPFREWLLKPQAGQSIDETNALEEEWRDTATGIAREYGAQLVEEAGEPAFLGRWVEIEKDRKQHFSSPEAFNCFLGKLKNI